MIIGNRTLTTRYILPFLFDSNKLFNDKYKFVNAYISDINRPHLDSHIFVLFEYDTNIYSSVNNYMKENKYLYDSKLISINGILYQEYIFVIPNEYKNVIQTIKDGFYNDISYEYKEKIILFWKNICLSYLKGLLETKHDITEYKSLEEKGEIVGEEDPPANEVNFWTRNIFAYQLYLWV